MKDFAHRRTDKMLKKAIDAKINIMVKDMKKIPDTAKKEITKLGKSIKKQVNKK